MSAEPTKQLFFLLRLGESEARVLRGERRSLATATGLPLSTAHLDARFGSASGSRILIRLHWAEEQRLKSAPAAIERRSDRWVLSTLSTSAIAPSATEGDLLWFALFSEGERWHGYLSRVESIEQVDSLPAVSRYDAGCVELKRDEAARLLARGRVEDPCVEATRSHFSMGEMPAEALPGRRPSSSLRERRDAVRALKYPLDRALADLVDAALLRRAQSITVRLVRSASGLEQVLVYDDATEPIEPQRLEEGPSLEGEILRGLTLGPMDAALCLAESATCLSLADNASAGWQLREDVVSTQSVESLRELLTRVKPAIARGTPRTHIVWLEKLVPELAPVGSEDGTFQRFLGTLETALGRAFHRALENGLILRIEHLRSEWPERMLPSSIEPQSPFSFTSGPTQSATYRFIAQPSKDRRLEANAYVVSSALASSEDLDGLSGLYLYQRDRLVAGGGWFGVEEEGQRSLRLVRVAVDLGTKACADFTRIASDGSAIAPTWFAAELRALRSDRGHRWQDYIEAARKEERMSREKGPDRAAFVPARGVSPETSAILRDVRAPDDVANEVDIAWGQLPEAEVFAVKPDSRTLLLNDRYRSSLDGTQSELVKVLLFFLVEKEFDRIRLSPEGKARVRELNQVLSALLRERKTAKR